MVLCSNEHCKKMFHLKCVGLSKMPEANTWICNICKNKKTIEIANIELNEEINKINETLPDEEKPRVSFAMEPTIITIPSITKSVKLPSKPPKPPKKQAKEKNKLKISFNDADSLLLRSNSKKRKLGNI